MSYDIEIYTRHIHHDSNYTCNVWPMYERAYEVAQEKEIARKNSGEYKWLELKPDDFRDCFKNSDKEGIRRCLKLMVEALEETPEEYKAMEPENGWGDYEGAVKFLRDAYIALLENPDSELYFDN